MVLCRVIYSLYNRIWEPFSSFLYLFKCLHFSKASSSLISWEQGFSDSMVLRNLSFLCVLHDTHCLCLLALSILHLLFELPYKSTR